MGGKAADLTDLCRFRDGYFLGHSRFSSTLALSVLPLSDRALDPLPCAMHRGDA